MIDRANPPRRLTADEHRQAIEAKNEAFWAHVIATVSRVGEMIAEREHPAMISAYIAVRKAESDMIRAAPLANCLPVESPKPLISQATLDEVAHWADVPFSDECTDGHDFDDGGTDGHPMCVRCFHRLD